MPWADKLGHRGVSYAAFDGSGTLGTHRAMQYGGALSTLPQWQAFAESWGHLLEKHDLAYFKMAEAMGFYGEFGPKATAWGAERVSRRDELLFEFGALRERYRLRVTGAGVVQGTSGVGPFEDNRQALLKKKHVFQHAVEAMLSALPADHCVVMHCDIEKDAEEMYRGWIESLARKRKQPLAARVVGIGFYDDRYSHWLQLADMISWLFRDEATRWLERPEAPINPLFLLVVGRERHTFAPVGPEGAPLGVEYALRYDRAP